MSTTASRRVLLAALLWATAAAAPPPGPLREPVERRALASDDECLASADGAECAANAMQRRALKTRIEPDVMANTTRGSCAIFGCGRYVREHSCQCNAACGEHGNCCADYRLQCEEPSCAHYSCERFTRSAACQCNLACGSYGDCCWDYLERCPLRPRDEKGAGRYGLSWQARGASFFDGFEFLNGDGNHGSAGFLKRGQAFREGVVQAHGTHAIIQAGRSDPATKYKRHTAKVGTKRSWTHFLAVVKVTHTPYGCGVWPAIFTLPEMKNGGWLKGGEMDVLEYVNDEVSKTSFHTDAACTLKASEVSKYGRMPDGNEMNYSCFTKYPDDLGCAPNRWPRNGAAWAQSPGVFALERTRDFAKIFFFPEGAVPADLHSNRPRPETWQRFMLSYYPFVASGCSPTVMKAQRLIISIAFCGDWASKVWGDSASCVAMTKSNRCRPIDPLDPKDETPMSEDCCTQFIWDKDRSHGTDEYLRPRAFYNISWVKVFQTGK